MKGLTIVNTDNKLILTVDKNNFAEEVLLELYKVARLQYLISKADFDESVLGYGGNKKRLVGE